jgi:uncharacterized membrane protein YphA (DoxX/SURF4 family)
MARAHTILERAHTALEHAHTARNVTIWVLSVLLAAVFVIAGVPKLMPGETYWVEAFAMYGYPGWLRTVVGVVETVGAACLLVPSLATYAAIALAVVMFGATYTELVRPGPATFIPPILLVLLLLLAWLRKPEAAHEVQA